LETFFGIAWICLASHFGKKGPRAYAAGAFTAGLYEQRGAQGTPRSAGDPWKMGELVHCD